MAKLGQLLVARGWITVQQLTRALKNQNVAGGRLGTCLLEMDALSEDLLLKGLAEHHGVPAAGPDDLRGVPEEVLELVPGKLARRLRCIPFHVELSRLDLAVTDPRNLSAQDEIAFASGKRVKVFVAPEIRILEALEKYYGEECPSRFGNVLDRLNRARYLWDKPAPAQQPELTQPLLHGPFDTPPRMKIPPHLPDFAPPVATPSPALPRPPAPSLAAAPGAAPLATAGATALAPSPVAEMAPAAAPAAKPAPPPPVTRAKSVSLTPEERVELGAFSWVEPATGHSGQAPITLDEATAALDKAGDLDQVGEVLLGFLGRNLPASGPLPRHPRPRRWLAHPRHGHRPRRFRPVLRRLRSAVVVPQSAPGEQPLPGPPAAHARPSPTGPHLGGRPPRDCVMLPVRVKERMVLVLYADGATGGTISLPTVQQLTAAATAAVERCILARKHGEAK